MALSSPLLTPIYPEFAWRFIIGERHLFFPAFIFIHSFFSFFLSISNKFLLNSYSKCAQKAYFVCPLRAFVASRIKACGAGFYARAKVVGALLSCVGWVI